MFDFSERRSLKRAAEVVTAVNGVPRVKPLLVLPIGDALQEPFWPEGLGVNRGFHNALDACWAAGRWREARDGGEAAMRRLVEQRQALYAAATPPTPLLLLPSPWPSLVAFLLSGGAPIGTTVPPPCHYCLHLDATASTLVLSPLAALA